MFLFFSSRAPVFGQSLAVGVRAGVPLAMRIGARDFDAPIKHHIGGTGVRPHVGAGAAFRRFFTIRENMFSPGHRWSTSQSRWSMRCNGRTSQDSSSRWASNRAALRSASCARVPLHALADEQYSRWLLEPQHPGEPGRDPGLVYVWTALISLPD